MGKFNNLRNRPFMMISLVYRPKDGINTSVKGWQEQPRSMQVIEKADFYDRVNDKHFSKYSVIIDLFHGEVLSHRIPEKTNQEVFDYFTNKYRDQINESVGLFMKKMRDSGRKDLILKEMNNFIERFKDVSGNEDPTDKLVLEEKGLGDAKITID